MAGFRGLPAYQYPENALLNLAPINAAITDYRQREQQGLENERQNKLMQLNQDRFGLEKGRFRMEQQRFTREQQERDQTFPLELERSMAQLAQTQASTAATNAQLGQIKSQTPQARAALAGKYGLQPGTQEYNSFVLNGTFTPQNPIDVATGNLLTRALPGATTPQPRYQPQSFEGPGPQQGDPNLIRVQDAPRPQTPAPDAGSIFSGMPPEEKRRTGEALLLNPRTKALGEQLLKDVERGSIGSTGQNELDKEIIAKATDVADLNTIKQQFDPQFLGLEARVKSTGLDWKSWISSKSLKPEERQYLSDYTRLATATTERLNNRIKALSGAAVSAAEEKRMFAANPTMNDSPDVFKAKLDQQLDMQRMAVARFNWIKSQYKGTPEQIAQLAQSGRIEAFPLEGMKRIYNDRGAQIEQELQRQGVPPQRINDMRRRQLMQEFGI